MYKITVVFRDNPDGTLFMPTFDKASSKADTFFSSGFKYAEEGMYDDGTLHVIPGHEIVKVLICEVCFDCKKEFVRVKKVEVTQNGVKMFCCEICATGLENESEGE